MIINKMTASFGKLCGDSIELKDGLNVITMPNESGKSTWCAFIRAMLYGIDSSERQKSGRLPDKLRYQPWSGAVMQGTMELSANGRDIEISRTTRLKSAPMREFSAVYSGTNIPVEGLNGGDAGEMLTGVSRDVFCRSAFTAQGSISVGASPELEKRIASIVSTGEEGCSYTEADERLRAWQRKRKYNRRGRLPELEEEIAAEERKLSELGHSSEQRAQLQSRCDELDRRCDELEERMLDCRKSARKDALNTLHDIRSECDAARAENDRAKRNSESCRARLEESPVFDSDGKISRERFSEDKANIESCLEASRRKVSLLPAILLFIVAIACAVIGVVSLAYAFIGTVAAAVIAVLLLVSANKKKREAEAAKRKAESLMLCYGASSPEEAESNFEEYLKLYELGEIADRALAESEKKLSAAVSRRERIENETLRNLDFNDGGSEAAEIGRRLAMLRSEREQLSAKLSELKGRADATGDPLVIGSKLSEMRDSYREINGEYAAIALAIDTLRAADAEIQSRFSPELGKKAAEYFSFMTGGKYDSLTINRDMAVKVRESGGAVAIDTPYLSAGAQDLMYLAVRLAVCELALPEGTVCPLILDDTLSNLDDERTERAMRLLREIAKKRQVILFTCRKAI